MPTNKELLETFVRELDELASEETDVKADKLAERERVAVEAGEGLLTVEGYADEQRIIRGVRLRDAVHWGARTFVRFAVILVVAAVAIWAWHILAPAESRWLSADEVRVLQTILFSGAISALATALGQSAFKD